MGVSYAVKIFVAYMGSFGYFYRGEIKQFLNKTVVITTQKSRLAYVCFAAFVFEMIVQKKND